MERDQDSRGLGAKERRRCVKMNNAEIVGVLKGLESACNELMTEFVSRKRAADWEIVNDALCASTKARAALSQTPAKESRSHEGRAAIPRPNI